MADLGIRNIDEEVKRRLRVRAAHHGRSMEAEIRAILEEAVKRPADSESLLSALRDRFASFGRVELELPRRSMPARAADLSP
jgi:antitoxin FitA